MEGFPVGMIVGSDGFEVGRHEGYSVGFSDGPLEGFSVGMFEGLEVGVHDGLLEGLSVGLFEGAVGLKVEVGTSVGEVEGGLVGTYEGRREGPAVEDADTFTTTEAFIMSTINVSKLFISEVQTKYFQSDSCIN